MAKLTADLQQSQLQGQAHAQKANTLQDQIFAEQRMPTTPSFSPSIINTPPSIPHVLSPSPAIDHPPPDHPLNLFAAMRNPAAGDPMQAGGDSTQEPPKAPPGQDPSSAARVDPSVNKARVDPSVKEVPQATTPAPAQNGQGTRPRTPPGIETKVNTPPGHILLKEAQALVFDHWPAYHRFELWKSHFYREIAA